MKLELHVHVHIYSEGKTIMDELARLTTEVAETKTVVDSAITLLGGLAQQIRDLKGQPAALAALADKLDAQQAALAAAIVANTPGPDPEPDPDPNPEV